MNLSATPKYAVVLWLILYLVLNILGLRLAIASEGLQAAGGQNGDDKYDYRLRNVKKETLLMSTERGIQIYIDVLFKVENHRRVLNSAVRKYLGVAWDGEVLDCTFGSPRRNTPKNRQAFVNALRARLAPGASLYVLQFAVEVPQNRFGWPLPAQVGVARLNIPINAIGINSTSLNRLYGVVAPDFPRRANMIAGVVGHELIHNMGYSHPVDSQGEQSFDDFVYIYGKCVTDRLDQLE